jgi:hypothetical protein
VSSFALAEAKIIFNKCFALSRAKVRSSKCFALSGVNLVFIQMFCSHKGKTII